MKSNAEQYQARKQNGKKYNAYVSRDTAEKFDLKLKEKNLTFATWLRDRIDKFLRNN